MSWRTRAYDDLPALSVRGPELRKNLRIVTTAWMYGVVWMACISSSHVPIFNRMVGFNEFAFGLMAAIPFLATFSQLIAAVIIERTGLRKYQFLDCALIHRLMWVPIGLIALVMPVPSRTAVVLVLALSGASWFIESLGRPAWWTWMSDLIPRRIRGRYFALRARRSQMVMIGVVILLGLLMDKNWDILHGVARVLGIALNDTPDGRQSLLLRTMSAVFIVGGLFGAMDIIHFRKVREVMPPRREEFSESARRQLTLRGLLIEPLRDRVFRHYIGYGATITFTITVSSVYFWLFAMERLGFNRSATNLLFLVIGPLADMAASLVWGKVIDRWGRRPVLIVATIGTMFSIVPWLLATPTTPAPAFVATAGNWLSGHLGAMVGHGDWKWITPDMPVGAYLLASLACVVGGTSWSGVNLACTGVMLGFGDGSGRSKFVAASGVLISMGGLVGGIVGGIVSQALRGMPELGPFLWGNFQMTFLLSAAVRLGAVAWLIGMPETGAASVWFMLQQVRINIYNAVQSRWSYPVRIFGWGRGEDRRARGEGRRPKRQEPSGEEQTGEPRA